MRKTNWAFLGCFVVWGIVVIGYIGLFVYGAFEAIKALARVAGGL